MIFSGHNPRRTFQGDVADAVASACVRGSLKNRRPSLVLRSKASEIPHQRQFTFSSL